MKKNKEIIIVPSFEPIAEGYLHELKMNSNEVLLIDNRMNPDKIKFLNLVEIGSFPFSYKCGSCVTIFMLEEVLEKMLEIIVVVKFSLYFLLFDIEIESAYPIYIF